MAWDVEISEDPGFGVVQLGDDGSPPGTRLTDRIKDWASRYPPVTPGQVSSWRRALHKGGYDAAVVSVLPLTRDTGSVAVVWAAADEMALMHVSRFRPGTRDFDPWFGLKMSTTGWFNELVHRDEADEVWVVSEQDARWMRAAQLHSRVRNIPNGVDLDYFRSVDVQAHPKRIAFWGVLDFRPNTQALEWFIPNVFEPLREAEPEAELLLIGRRPTDWVRSLADLPGVVLREDVPDLRPEVCSASVAAFPFVSGFGIKNKLLEGAAMSRALVCSPRAVDGLFSAADPAWKVCETGPEWIETIRSLWADPQGARDLGGAARRWVEENYHWDRAARQAEESLERAVARRRG